MAERHATAPVEVGRYRLSFEQVRRKLLAASDLKVPNQVEYANAWVLRAADEQGRWRFQRAFLSEAAAREWAAANP
jgi:hypothetical protein